MRKRILSMLLVLVMVLGMLPAQVFATDTPTEPCITEGCTFGAGHEGNCSNYVAPSEPCETEGCTYGANHEGNCSNYVEPTADELAAQAVVDLIDAIGSVTLESETAISAADTAYNALTDEQKALVTNLAVLEKAKADFGALHEAEPAADVTTTIYDTTVGDTPWHTGNNYAKKVKIKAPKEVSYAWSGDVCMVKLPADTSLSASLQVILNQTGSITATFNGETGSVTSTAHKVSLENGVKTVAVAITADSVTVTKTIILYVDGVTPPAPPTPDTPDTPSRPNGEVYNKDTDTDEAWSISNGGAYVTTVMLTGETVKSVQWNNGTCNVVLASDTAADANVTFTVTVDGARQVVMQSGVTIDGTVQSSKQGTVQLENGQKSVEIKFGRTGQEVAKIFNITIEGGGIKNEKPVRKEGVAAEISQNAYIGIPFTLNLADIFEDADGDTLNYSVKIDSNAAVAADAAYSYTPTETGNVVLTFAANDGKADSKDTYKVTLNVKELGITLEKSEVDMSLGSILTLTADGIPEGTDVVWTSSDESVATVADGVVTTVALGTAVITASAEGKSASCTVTVIPKPEPAAPANVKVTISKQGVLVLVNASVTVTDLNSDGKLTYDEAMVAAHEEYHADGADAFAINQDSGWVIKLWGEQTVDLAFFKNNVKTPKFVNNTTVKNGDALYVGFYSDVSSWKDWYTMFTPATVTVQQGEAFELTLTGFSALLDNVTAAAVGSAQVGIWEDGTFEAIPNKTTDENGKVELSIETAGTYIISAYDNSQSAPLMAPVCVVTVEEAAPTETVALNKTELSLTVGGKETLTATVTPEGTAVTWSTSDEAVAKVENGVVTAVAAGTATITAKAGEVTASCTVKVTANLPTLSALKFSASGAATSVEYALEPAFDPAVREYTVIVPDNTNQFFAWATLGEGLTNNTKIKIKYLNTSGKETTKGITSGAAKGVSIGSFIKNGHDVKELSVLIADETAYTVKVVRKSQLTGITLSSNGSEAPLTPAFSNTTTEYSATVAYDKELTLGATATFSTSTFTVNGQAVDAVKAATVSFIPQWDENMSSVVTVVAGSSVVGALPTEYTINLSQRAAKIEILDPPDKTEYKPGEKFDPTGMTLRATYSDGSTKTITPDNFSYSPTEELSPAVTEVAISYDSLTVTQPIKVKETFKGSGTEEDPYLIETADDLVRLSALVADGLSFVGEYFKMVADITLPASWEPIGKSLTKPFSGNFDGGNHLLTIPEGGLSLIGTPRDASLSNLNVYGSQIAGYGVVNGYTNDQSYHPAITIDNVTLKAGTKTLKSGFIGGYASGQNTVIIRNSTVEKGVTIGYSKNESRIGSFGGEFNGTISNCVSYADVYGSEYVGGIVAVKGQTMGDFIVTGCQFYGTVTGTSYVGGIVSHGYAGGSQYDINSAPHAPIVTIKNCSCSGTVTGASFVGGILGAERATAQAWYNGIGHIENNSFTSKVSGSSYVGAIIGYMRSLNKYTVISGNYYAAGCGATKGIGGAEYVDTNCQTHETASGVTYLNTENGTSGCPSIQYCSWQVAHNRTDDPLGADKSKLCYTDADVAPVATELKISGTYKTEYMEGEDLDLTGIVLTVHYNKGDPKTIELEDVTVTGYDKTKVGEQTVTLAYSGLTADIKITVNRDGRITVTVAVLGDSKHNSDADGIVHNLGSGNLTTWVSATEVKLEGTVTAWDAISKVLSEKGLSCSYSYSSKYGSYYIEAVNGLGEFTNGVNSGWLYSVNGKKPNVGVSAYYLEDGDKIVLHYTDDYTKGGGGSVNGDEAAVEKVEKLIDAIGTVTLEKMEEIETARKAFDNLTYAQKQKVKNYEKLTDAEIKYAKLKKDADEKAAKKVEDLIDKLDSKSETFEEDVKGVQKAYNALTADQKKLVDNYFKLTNALKQLAEQEDKKAAEEVELLIVAIGTVTRDSGEKIKTARDAYDALTEEQKALVENLFILEAAEDKLAKLEELKEVLDIHEATGDFMEDLGTPVPGTVGGEWMVVGLVRADRELKELDAYYEAAEKFVQENADENSRLHKAKSTENSRMILALTAMGKDVTNVGGHNLLEGLNSMEYVQKQGINGPIWALIAFDSGNYATPAGDVSRESLLDVILNARLEDGGWALSGELSDADMTGMALQALAPYYETNEDVAAAVDAAIEALSLMQAADGSFSGIDGKSSESIAQVIVALSALGIDADTDPRFIKNGISALDALYAFYVEGGGFRHIPDGELDGMATEQAYYALTAYFRMVEGKTALYDMTDVVDMGGDKEIALPAETEPVQKVQEEKELTFWQKANAWFKKLF